MNQRAIQFKPIGHIKTDAKRLPRHWSVSNAEGYLDIFPEYVPGLKDIQVGQRVVVLFHFHKSPEFSESYLSQTPPHRYRPFGVFSICSPVRPNPIGMSVVEVLAKHQGLLKVKNIDMMDGTPILDIKPLIHNKKDCPSVTTNG